MSSPKAARTSSIGCSSKVTECARGEVFEFIAQGYSVWRYEFAEHPEGTRLTESFSYTQYTGAQKFFYETIFPI